MYSATLESLSLSCLRPRACLVVILQPPHITLNIHRSCKHCSCRSGEPYMLTRRGPRNHRSAARQVDLHLLIQESAPLADGDGGAGPRAASQSLARPALVYPQSKVAAIDDLHESHVGALRKTRMMLDTRPKPLDRRGIHIRHLQHRMRIAHRHRAYLDIRTVDLQR